MSFPSLESVLEYSNPYILERFCKKNKISEQEAKEIFQETLKMLWLMALRHKEGRDGVSNIPKKILVFSQMAVLDESWHNFVLFTKEYSAFCQEYFGHYLHHSPTTSKERAEEGAPTSMDVEKQCEYIAEKLGIETLTLWFKKFPKRFTGFTS